VTNENEGVGARCAAARIIAGWLTTGSTVDAVMERSPGLNRLVAMRVFAAVLNARNMLAHELKVKGLAR